MANKYNKWVVLGADGDLVEVVNSTKDAKKLASQWARDDADNGQDSDILIAKVVIRVTTITPPPAIKFTAV